jgi:hypothetical protein
MAMHLVDCDEPTRLFMLEEIDFDAPPRQIYISPRLTEAGKREWKTLLVTAAKQGDAPALAAAIRAGAYLNTSEIAHRNGKPFTRAVPITAADTLAEGEYNRYYIRALCRRAQSTGVIELEIYRAKEVSSARPDSEAKIGTRVNVEALLKDLRENIGIDTALGLPPGPNSGLSVRLPR